MFVAVVLASPACTPNRVAPVAGGANSPLELAQAVLDALAAGDRDTLRHLSVSEREFKDHVWPDLPAARPERNLPFAYVWKDLAQKSDQHLAQTLAKFGGQRLVAVNVEFAGETTRYRTSMVHRESVVLARLPDGKENRVRIFGSVLEQDGRFKVFSYVVD